MRERFTAARGVAAVIAGLGVLGVSVFAFFATAPPAGARDLFQVEFRDCVTLHLGYRDFPPGTVVHYVVRQNGQVVDRGQFVVQGGNQYHFLNIRLRHRLTPAHKAVVIFDGHYTVFRAPGCIGPSGSTVPTSVPVTNAGSTVPQGHGTVVPVSAAAGNRGPLAFTGSNVPTTLIGLLVLVFGASLLALGLRGPLSRRRMPEHVLPPWLHVPVPTGSLRRRGGGGGRSPKSARKHKLPPWLHTGVPSRRRRG